VAANVDQVLAITRELNAIQHKEREPSSNNTSTGREAVAQESLQYGAVVYLLCPEYKGYVTASPVDCKIHIQQPGSYASAATPSPVHSMDGDSEADTVDLDEIPDNFELCLFSIQPYDAGAYLGSGNRTVCYGDIIRLQHVTSLKYVSALKRDWAHKETSKRRVSLAPGDSQHRNWSTWKIMPRYRKVRGEGHKVCNKDEIMLELNRGDDFLHVSGARNDDDVHEATRRPPGPWTRPKRPPMGCSSWNPPSRGEGGLWHARRLSDCVLWRRGIICASRRRTISGGLLHSISPSGPLSL